MGYTRIIQSGNYTEVYQYEKDRYTETKYVRKNRSIPKRSRRREAAAYRGESSIRFRSAGSISRAKAGFFRLVQANLTGAENPAFLTLTTHRDISVALAYKYLNDFWARMRKNLGVDLKYVSVPEWQKKSGFILGIDTWNKKASLEGTNSEANSEWWAKVDFNYVYNTLCAAIDHYELTDYCGTIRLNSKTVGLVIADNIFDLEEDVIEDSIATPEDVELASLLISDFKDLILEIDEITGMIHDVSYMDDHLAKIKSYLPTEDFEINVAGLPNYINEASTGGRKRNFASELAEKQMLIGPLMTPGKLISRVDEKTGEEYQVFFSKETIEKIAYKMMKDGLASSVNIEHDGAKRLDDVYLVETWLVKDPEKDKSSLYGFSSVPGEWYGIYRVGNGRVWNEYIKTGKVKGFSVEGYFYNNVLTKK